MDISWGGVWRKILTSSSTYWNVTNKYHIEYTSGVCIKLPTYLTDWMGKCNSNYQISSHTIPFDLNIVLYFGHCIIVYPSPINGFWLSLWDILLYTYMYTYNEKQKVGTIPKSDRKIVKTEIPLIPLTHTYMNISFLTLVHSFQ